MPKPKPNILVKLRAKTDMGICCATKYNNPKVAETLRTPIAIGILAAITDPKINSSATKVSGKAIDPLPRLKARGIQDSGRDSKLSLSDIP
jgi:hypothetical protein